VTGALILGSFLLNCLWTTPTPTADSAEMVVPIVALRYGESKVT